MTRACVAASFALLVLALLIALLPLAGSLLAGFLTGMAGHL